MFAYYFDDCEERYKRFGRALELYASLTTIPNALPHCSIGVWAIGQITWPKDCTAEDVQKSLFEFFHVGELKPELWNMYISLISAIVVREPRYTGPGADHDRSDPVPDQDFLIDGKADVLLTEKQCKVIASSAFIELLNNWGASCMTFPCYANIPFLVDTLLAVLYAELTNLNYALQFHILMGSLSVPQTTFPCTNGTLVAMEQSLFMRSLMGTHDWQRRLTYEGFAFLNVVLVTFLELSSLPHGVCEAYLRLVSRVDVVIPKKPTKPSRWNGFCSWIREVPTFTLSHTSAPTPTPTLVDVGKRIDLTPEEATAMTSPGFIAYIKKDWGTFLYPVVGYEEDPYLRILQLWDKYHSSCFPLPKSRGE
jgi:hypothetical protein